MVNLIEGFREVEVCRRSEYAAHQTQGPTPARVSFQAVTTSLTVIGGNRIVFRPKDLSLIGR